jgi:putative pyruvate formate lyase activating enzyme
MIIRHLLMPGHGECCFRPVVDWTAEHLPGARFQLHSGYVPCWRAGDDPAMGRLNLGSEVGGARAYLSSKNLRMEGLASASH